MTTTIPGPFERVDYGGEPMDHKTMAAINLLERELGYPLTIVKGCYLPADANSATTHVGGGVVDLAPWDHRRKVKIGRENGWAIWFRPELWIDGELKWRAHCHAVLIGHGRLSGGAAAQVAEYLAGGDGLVGSTPDPNPYRPPFETFRYWDWIRDDRIRARITGLRATIGRIRDRISANRSRITYK